MNEHEIINHMIEFIIEEEKKILNQKFLLKNVPKSTTIRNLIAELERVMEHED